MPYKRESKSKKSKKSISNKPISKKSKSKKPISKKQNGGKLNAFFKSMLDAKKKNLSEFKYNGNTYKQSITKTGLKIYKKA